jgi:rhodanese-related sulfurtransferase
MASHAAAREAAKLGYTNVFVMPDGILGWVKAKKRVEAGG